jgi:hypothetical protein
MSVFVPVINVLLIVIPVKLTVALLRITYVPPVGLVLSDWLEVGLINAQWYLAVGLWIIRIVV